MSQRADMEDPPKALICDADCAAMFGPLDFRTFTEVRREARRHGWARHWISWHGIMKLADLCPEDAGMGMVM